MHHLKGKKSSSNKISVIRKLPNAAEDFNRVLKFLPFTD